MFLLWFAFLAMWRQGISAQEYKVFSISSERLEVTKSLDDVSDFLQGELDEKIKNGNIPITGMVLDGVSDDGVPVRLEVRLSVRGDGE